MILNGNWYRKRYQLLFTALQCLERRDVLHDVTIATIECLYVILLFIMAESIISFDEMVKELWWHNSALIVLGYRKLTPKPAVSLYFHDFALKIG